MKEFEGKIIKALSGFYYVESDGKITQCKAKGRFRLDKTTPLVGDNVIFAVNDDGNGTVKKIMERKNYFLRPAVANLDQMIILASAVIPITVPFLIDRIAALAELNNCEPIICINKSDLDSGDELYDIYNKAGFKTIHTSAVTMEGIDELRAVLKGKFSAFTGNSGVGKSSILNALEPSLAISTGDVSDKLGRGRHTTRHVELYRVGEDGFVADTPGFSSFDADQVEYIAPEKLQYAFRDFSDYIGDCRFNDCIHVKTKGCAVMEAVEEGKIQKTRYDSYVRLYEQAKQVNQWEVKQK